MSDAAEEKWKLELVMFIVNTVSKKIIITRTN